MNEFKRGLKAGIPIALGYFSVSFAFGIMCITYGLTWWEATFISMLTLTSSGQFAGVIIMMNPGQYIQMLISQFTINLRYAFMGVSLSQKLEVKFRGIYRWIFAFFITDEIFGVAISQKTITRAYMAGLGTLPWFGWSGGTMCGALMGNILPDSVMNALGLALYGMFIAVVVPEMKSRRPVIWVVLAAFLFSCCFYYIPMLKSVSTGISIAVCAIAAAIIGALLFPVDDEPEKEVQ